MHKDYTREELDKILLSKNLDEYYFAILETKLENIRPKNIGRYIDNSRVLSNEDSEMEEFLTREVMKICPYLGRACRMAVLTMIGNDIYNIARPSFIDLNIEKIVRFDNITRYFNEDNARIRMFTTEEDSHINENQALLELDDESIALAYEKEYIKHLGNNDLTLDFIIDAKGRSKRK